MAPARALRLLAAAVALAAAAAAAAARTRTVHLSADEVEWDYAPAAPGAAGDNACYARPYTPDELLYVAAGAGRVGAVYRKAVFRAYADAGFRRPAPRPPAWRHLGLLGPPLRAEVGDKLVVVLRNAASFPFAFDPAGLAPHPDNPRDPLPPGDTATYRYDVGEEAGPDITSTASSVMHFYTARQPDGANDALYAGLLGPVIVTAKGFAADDGSPNDVDHEVITVLWIADENASPLWESVNANRTQSSDRDCESADEEEKEEEEEEEGADEDFEESNRMHVINGYVFCTLPNISLPVGETTRWYAAAIGNEADLHALHWHGVVGVTAGGLHTDSVRLLPGSALPVDFVPDNPGRWLGHCHVGLHLEHAGMLFLYDIVGPEVQSGHDGSPATRTREYFIQAEDAVWDYTPDAENICDAGPFGDDENIFVEEHFPIEDEDGAVIGYGIGSKYIKTRYVQYTDDTFSTVIPGLSDAGIMGPVIRARVGEDIVLHFKNNCSDPVSLHTHGLFYLKDSEGAPYADGSVGKDTKGDVVQPGDEYTYLWQANERSGPGPGELFDSKLWIYHSHRNEVEDTYAGLFGAILIITAESQKYDNETLLPIDGTDEVFLHFSVMNEGSSYHIGENAVRDPDNKKLSEQQLESLLENDDFVEGNLMHAINGYMYCNGPQTKLQVGRPAHLYMYSLGSDVDFHSVSLENEVLRLDEGATRGSAKLLAGTFASAVVTPLASGPLELRCSIDDHIAAGMRKILQVAPAVDNYTDSVPKNHSAGRVFYIAAEEVEWDYAPTDEDGCTGEEFGEDQHVFTEAGDDRPGSKYIKALYRRYKNATYSEQCDEELSFSGVVGPMLLLEVGETFTVFLKNNLPFEVNLNIAGVEFVESSLKATDDGVAPGETEYTVWRVSEDAAPGPNDLSSVAFVYYSSVDSIVHAHAGLVGAVSVTRKGGLSGYTGLPPGCSRVVPLLFNIFRENVSPFIEHSLEEYALKPVDEETLEELQEDDDWLESNAMHSVNGFLYCNNPSLKTNKGDVVRFVVFGYGSEASMHSPFFEGQVIDRSTRVGTSAGGVQIFPYTAESVDVVMTGEGLRSVGCLVADHVAGGMAAKIEVVA